MTNLLHVKLRRDLRATWPRLALMVIAIAVSLTAFSTVLFAWSAISRETGKAYLSTEPASATIRFGPGVDAAEMARITAEVRSLPGVLEAAGRTQFTSDIEVNGSPREIPLAVYAAAPDDPMRMASFEVLGGQWPPAPGEIFVRRDSLGLLGVAVGDTVTVETPDGDKLRLKVSGTVYDPSLAPAPQQQQGQAYLSTASLAALGKPDVFDQLKIQIADPGQAVPSRNRDVIVARAGEVAIRLQQQQSGLAVREIQVPKPYAHPHQGQADALLSALLIGAGAALLLSTILVANMLNNLFTQQIPQIGIMKAIGGRSSRIGRLYLAMTLVVTGAATLFAVGPALVLSRAFAPSVLGFLGIQSSNLAAPWWTYLAVVAAGLVLPVLMALVPLVKTARTTVRAAIDHDGLGSKPNAATGPLTRLGRVPGLDRGLLMALRNTVRRPARFFLSVGLLASAGMLFVGGMSTRDATAAIADEATQRLKWDVTAQLTTPASAADVTAALRTVPGVERIEGWSVASVGVAGPGKLPLTRTYPDQGHGGVSLAAIPEGTRMLTTTPTLREGRWLRPNETGAIVLNQITLTNTDLAVRPGGNVDLTVNGRTTTWRLVGITEERGDAGGAYVTAAGLAAALRQPPWPNTLRIATTSHDEQTRRAVATAVQDALTEAGIDVRSSESVGLREASTGGHLEPILVILLATALPMALIGLIGLASTMGANVLDRTREFGVMHAIGARPAAVRRIVVAEGVFVALASCLLAALPALGVTLGLNALLGNLFLNSALPLRISSLAIGLWMAIVIIGAVVATDAAASRASRLTVREALAYL